jgi:hypothetical protein
MRALRWLKFPSAMAAALVGAVCVPLAILGGEALSRMGSGDLVLIVWSVLTFLVPASFSTGDMKRVWADWKAYGIRAGMPRANDFREFMLPAWGRLMVLFASAVVSMLLLKYLFGWWS